MIMLVFHAWWEEPANGDMRSLIIEGFPTTFAIAIAIDKADFFPDANDNFEIQAATENLSAKTSVFASANS